MWIFNNHILRTEVINHIKARKIDRSEFDKDLDILSVKNGLINIRTGEFKDYDPNYLSLIQLPIPYNPKAKNADLEHHIKYKERKI